ncbi:aminoglycoside phosphotransferase family protein [Lederbergia panacisoli]|uniref:aminoglycoside phosphotransferase family protein n=1 Tax=Lederbergia panacisoli TaxID=1255251 RepID=UPI00214CD157|nr:aminoglycoside phosphotransferase family protein [Lederbergia panacisoli]MCR2823537.1 aminoglycoside phosphotransferase family protein [Lederbergia panacisoli]
MSSPISAVDWIEKSETVADLINQEDTLSIYPMNQGNEAEVIKIELDNKSFVLKVWNKSSKPDIHFQFHLLNALIEKGLSVSKPVGWGIDRNTHKVLLTTFDGVPVQKVNNKILIEIANILSTLHQMNNEDIETIQLPKYDFVSYFFPELSKHHDLNKAVISLVNLIQIRQDRIIHGDFHLNNILEENNRYTVIDWTNGQLGDPRYDFSWSLILKKIYISDRLAQVFRSAYLSKNKVPSNELDIFEALAYLKWILLSRSNSVPIGPKTIEKVKSLIRKNPFLLEVDVVNGKQ